MKVLVAYSNIATVPNGNGTTGTQSIEIGEASWDSTALSIRNRWDNNGMFDPISSAELPIQDLLLLVTCALRSRILGDADLKALAFEISMAQIGQMPPAIALLNTINVQDARAQVAHLK